MTGGHALWLLPEETTFLRLAALIDDLARRHRGPRFLPHVTLVSGILLPLPEVRARTRALARHQPPLAVTLGRAACRDEYYRALFVEVEGAALRGLHARAAAAVGVAHGPEYLPHLSLLYGEIEPAAKDRILDRVGRRWDERCMLDRLVAVSLEGPPPSWTPLVTEPLIRA